MKILIAGDFCPQNRVAKAFEGDDFATVLADITVVTGGADYSIVNLECPVVMRRATPIAKSGPNLKCSGKAINAIRFSGFDCVTLANNHFYDYGETGVKDTLDTLRLNGLDYVGGGDSISEASRILYKGIAGKTLAIINCCEHEFSIATETTGGSNPLNIIQQYYSIQEAKMNADYVVMIIHGGVEHFWLPTQRMKETYHFFVDAGADAVINHHQHCYSGYEVYKGAPIFYGLGNFCFDGDAGDERWTSGYMVLLSLGDERLEYELIPYRQCAVDNAVCLMHGDEKKRFFEIITGINSSISDSNKNQCEYERWCKKNEDIYKYALNPLYNRHTAWFFNGPLGKLLIKKNKWLYTKDILINESHIERALMMVENQIKNSK